MLPRVTAVRFDKVMGSGRTKPCLLTAAYPDGDEVEVVTKFAAGCDTGLRALMTEALTALLAIDLGLLVPEPFLVRVEADFAASIPDLEVQSRARASVGWNYGSKKLPPGFSTYPAGKPLPHTLIATAAEVLAFDVFTENPDRTVRNPNLLLRGEEIAIYDHELAFFMEGIIGWKPPWSPGAVRFPRDESVEHRHVFAEQLRGRDFDLDRLVGAFDAISDDRLTEYGDALPEEWVGDGLVLNRILEYIAELRDHVDAAAEEVKGALQ